MYLYANLQLLIMVRLYVFITLSAAALFHLHRCLEWLAPS